MLPLRIEKRSWLWIAGDWKFGTVSRPAPRSRPTTFKPDCTSSKAESEPVRPTPIVTASTDGRRCAMLHSSRALSGRAGRDVRVHMHVRVRILGETHRCAVDLDSMLVDQLVIRGIRAGKTDHPPAHHVAIAAVHRVAEVAFDRALPEVGEEHFRRDAAKVPAARLKALEIGVLFPGAHFGEGALQLLANAGKSRAEEFGRRVRQLVALAWRSRPPRPAPGEPLPRAPRACKLLVDVIGNTRFDRARPLIIGGEERRARAPPAHPFACVLGRAGGC